MKTNNELTQAFGDLADVPRLGALVWWTVSEVTISREDLKALFAEQGIPENALIDTRTRSAFKKALNEAEKDRLVRRIKDDSESIVYGIVEETADSKALDLTYSTENVVVYDKETKTLSFKATGGREQEIRAAFEKYLTGYTSNEVREIVRKFVVSFCDGFLARDGGGVYFVPESKTSELVKMEAAVSRINGGSHLFIMSVPDMKRERANALRLWVEEAHRQVAELEADVERLTGSEGTRKATLQARVEAFKALRSKADAYSTALGFEKETLEAKVKGLEAKVLKALLDD